MDNAIRDSPDESLAYFTKDSSSSGGDFSSFLALESRTSQKEIYQDDRKNGHNYNRNTGTNEEGMKDTQSKEESVKKRKNALMDDFFVIEDPKPKKKSKKTKKTKMSQSTDRKPETRHLSGTKSHSKEDTEVLVLDKVPSEGRDSTPDDQEIFKKTEKPPERSVTPPPAFDKQTMMKKELKKEKSRSRNKKEIELSDEEDEQEIELLRGGTQITSLFTKGSTRSEEVENIFSDENERNRMYRIQLVSKLNPASDSSAEFRTNGTRRFSSLLKRIIANFKNISKLAGTDASIYEESDPTLIWVDEKMELKPFYKPSTLRIPPPNKNSPKETCLFCLLIPKLNLTNFTSIYSEFRPQSSGSGSLKAEPLSLDVDSILESTDKDDNYSPREQQSQRQECGNNDYFIIGLKGKDNKRIEVQVSPSTPIHKLLHYFLEIKGIDKNEIDFYSAKLIFDDEKLDLNGKIGDTELEEDFEVQVVL